MGTQEKSTGVTVTAETTTAQLARIVDWISTSEVRVPIRVASTSPCRGTPLAFSTDTSLTGSVHESYRMANARTASDGTHPQPFPQRASWKCTRDMSGQVGICNPVSPAALRKCPCDRVLAERCWAAYFRVIILRCRCPCTHRYSVQNVFRKDLDLLSFKQEAF